MNDFTFILIFNLLLATAGRQGRAAAYYKPLFMQLFASRHKTAV